jgi:hypothetical protein
MPKQGRPLLRTNSTPGFTLDSTTRPISFIRGSREQLQPNCITVRPGLHRRSPSIACLSDDRMFEIFYLDPERLLPVLIPRAT